MRALALALGGLLALSACQPGGVVRVVDGREVQGRFVSPEAYSDFLEGVLEETRGDLAAARTAYARASAEDPQSAEIWGRLGAVLCSWLPKSADLAFSRAELAGPDEKDGPLARAECALERGDIATAVTSAERAVRAAPGDPETTVALARAYERRGDWPASRRWLRGLMLRGGNPETTRALRAAAVRNGDGPEAALSLHRIRTLTADLGGRLTTDPTSVDGALGENDLALAKNLAVGAHIPSSELALRAVRSGRAEFAGETARRVLAAEPGSTDARIAALASADLRQNAKDFVDLVKPLPKARTGPTDLGAQILSELLSRRLGPEAARAFDKAYGAADAHTAP